MIGLLQAGKGHNVESLAAHCNISRRTVFRDLEVLRRADVPLKHDDEFQVYHLDDTYFLPPTKFTASEALAVLVLCHELGDVRQMPFLAPARTAALKLESSLPAALRRQLRGMADAIQIRLHQPSPLGDKSHIYQELVESISERRCVRIDYDDLSARTVIKTRLSPYRLLFTKHSWYVIGRSSIHRSVRTFNVTRIRRLEPTEDRYQIPRNFSLERYLGNAWHLIGDPGPDYEVSVRFSQKVARNVAEVNWHKSQAVKWNEDGTLDFSATVKGLTEISWWVLGYGDQAKVLGPPQLQKLIVNHAKRMLQLYDWG
ncbi:MAG TPA: WYL domain-containing protein [Pirellulales bacterium]|nr:WYL domain-containing protein [Pirellulales bacterium]